MSTPSRTPILDPEGFNELTQCRLGPLLYNKHDTYVGGSLRKYGEFSMGETLLFEQLVRPGMLIVEVGSNLGAHSVGLAKLITKTGQLHAFEPQRLVFQTLCANVALNQLTNVFTYQMAVGDRSGTLLVPVLDPDQAVNFGGLSLQNTSDGESVPLVTIDQLALPACHFLKVDVEGMEVEVITGASRTIENYRPVMYVENDREDRSSELLELIARLDYTMYWHLSAIFNADNYADDPEDIFSNITSINLLCCPREREISIKGLREVRGPDDSWRQE